MLGSDSVELSSNVYFPSDGTYWFNYIYHHSGTYVNLKNFKVVLYRDITNSPDTYETKLGCSSSPGTTAECSGTTHVGN